MSEQPRILLVDDDPTVIAALASILRDLGELRFATSAADALRIAHSAPPDLVLLDIEMPGMGGFELCTAMKETPLLADVPIIFITSHDSPEQEVTGLTLGAVDFIAKPPRPPLVVARVRTQLRMKKMQDKLRLGAHMDALTGIPNRRLFDDTLLREWQRARHLGTPLSLLLIDLDLFKAYNDRYGHVAGDHCLRTVANVMRGVIHRPSDMLARMGGEEFALLLPATHATGAQRVAQYLIDAMDALNLAHAGSTVSDHVTLSIGVSTYDQEAREPMSLPREAESGDDALRIELGPIDLVAAADQALYAAKHAGRRTARFLALDAFAPPLTHALSSVPPSGSMPCV